MRVLVVGPAWHGLMTESCARAFAELGHEVETASSNRPPGLWNSVREAAYIPYVTRRLREMATAALNRHFLTVVKRFNPDLVFHLNGGENDIAPETFDAARRVARAKFVTWHLDDPFWFYRTIRRLDVWDLILCSIPEIATRLRFVTDRPLEQMSQACDPALTFPEAPTPAEREQYGCDIVMVSTGYLDGAGIHRGAVLARLARTHRVRIYGTEGWRRIARDFPILQQCYAGRPLRREEMNRCFLSAAIVLHLHHPQMRDGTTIRAFEIAGCGAFQLADYKAELAGLFRLGEELVCFKTVEELESQVAHYLAHPEERAAIAARGYERVVREHTFKHRMAWLLDRVAALSKS